MEFLALQHLRNSELRRQSYETFGTKRQHPLAVVADFCLLGIENLEDLRFVGLGVPRESVRARVAGA